MGTDGAGGAAGEVYGLADVGNDLIEGVASGGLGGPSDVHGREQHREKFLPLPNFALQSFSPNGRYAFLLQTGVNSFLRGRGAASTEKFLRVDCGCRRGERFACAGRRG